jgi:hypothetical protein
MKKKRLFLYLLILLLVVGGYFLITVTFPKNANRYPFFILLTLIDYYVWGVFKNKVYTYSQKIKTLTAFLYWLPLLALVISTLISYFYKTSEWNTLARNLLYGSIFSFYVAKIFIAIVLGLADIIKAVQKLIELFQSKNLNNDDSQRSKISRAKFMENIAIVAGGLVLSSMFMGMFKWVHDFNVKNLTIRFKNLPDVFDGFKIVQISDLHLGSWSGTDPLREAIETINRLEPDLVVFTGDLVNYTTDEAFRFKEILTELKAKDGVFGILGNHDYGDYKKWPSKAEKQNNMEALYQFYNQINWKLLRNEHIIIERDSHKIALIGVENWSVNTRFPQLGNIIKASKGIGQVSAKILLSHDPSHWDATVLKNHQDIELTLSGHTHGFQFGIEIPGIKWSPAQYIYKQWAGLYSNEATHQQLYVNRGLGSIGYPGRIGILPEITVINLQT